MGDSDAVMGSEAKMRVSGHVGSDSQAVRISCRGVMVKAQSTVGFGLVSTPRNYQLCPTHSLARSHISLPESPSPPHVRRVTVQLHITGSLTPDESCSRITSTMACPPCLRQGIPPVSAYLQVSCSRWASTVL